MASRRKTYFAMLFLSLLVSLVIITTEVYAEKSAAQTEWFKTYGIYKEEVVTSLISTSDGGYAFAGVASYNSSASANQAASGFWMVKIDSQGNIQWNKLYTQAGDDSGANLLIQTANGGYALAGTDITSTATEIWLITADSSGNLQSCTAINTGYSNNILCSLFQTESGNYVLGGSGSYPLGESGNSPSGYATWLIQVDTQGNILWSKQYSGVPASAIIQTSDGGYAIAASDGILIRTDSNGNLIWNRTVMASHESINSLIQTSDRGFAMAGETNVYTGDVASGSNVEVFAWLAKVDSNGNLQWQQTLTSAGQISNVKSLIQTNDGYALAGFDEQSGFTPDSCAFLFKTDANGNLDWNQTYAKSLTTLEVGLISVSGGRFVLAGSLTGSNTLNTGWVLETDANGNAPATSVPAVTSLNSPTPASAQNSSTPKIPEFPSVITAVIILLAASTATLINLKKKPARNFNG